MIQVYAIVAAALVISGAVIGVLAVYVAGIRCERNRFSLTEDSPGWAASRARAANGVYVRAGGSYLRPSGSAPHAGPGTT
jgi:hypothetical protein